MTRPTMIRSNGGAGPSAAARATSLGLFALAVISVLAGIYVFVMHVNTDPLADARVYYDAGARLNAGQPLYDAAATESTGLYLNPPLLAIIWRPLALLPFSAAAAIWLIALLVALALVFRRIGLGRPAILLACWLALPIGWALAVGQAEPIVTLLLAIGSPAAIAVAGNLKLFPLLVVVYWAARRDLRAIGRVAAWVAVLVVAQAVVEPQATLAFLQLTWIHPAFEVRSFSPFAVSPLLWVAMVAALAALAWRLAWTRYGWAAAVVLAVLAYPRLLAYQLMSLLAVLGGPTRDQRSVAVGDAVPGQTQPEQSE